MNKNFSEIYTSGEYHEKHPTWHVEDSPWKAQQILKMMQRNNLNPETVCEVGCGAGEILRQLQLNMGNMCKFYGYDISPHAIEICQEKANENLIFYLKDITQEKDISYDVILLIDILEHLENYLLFLRNIKSLSQYKIIHFPLDICVQNILRRNQLLIIREQSGHIHYFTKELALQTLKDTGYELMDYFYTPAFELPASSIKNFLARRFPQKILYALNKDLAAQIMGWYPLLVLAR